MSGTHLNPCEINASPRVCVTAKDLQATGKASGQIPKSPPQSKVAKMGLMGRPTWTAGVDGCLQKRWNMRRCQNRFKPAKAVRK